MDRRSSVYVVLGVIVGGLFLLTITPALPVSPGACSVIGQADASVTFSGGFGAIRPLCEEFVQGLGSIGRTGTGLCAFLGDPITTAACTILVRRYTSSLAIVDGEIPEKPVVCSGRISGHWYRVEDSPGRMYVGRAVCWYLTRYWTAEQVYHILDR